MVNIDKCDIIIKMSAYEKSRDLRAEAWQAGDMNMAYQLAVQGYDLAENDLHFAESARDAAAALVRGAVPSDGRFSDVEIALRYSFGAVNRAVEGGAEGAYRARAANYDWWARAKAVEAYKEPDLKRAQVLGQRALLAARNASKDFKTDRLRVPEEDQPDQMYINMLGVKSFLEARYGSTLQAFGDAIQQIRYGRHSEDPRYTRHVDTTKTNKQVKHVQRNHIGRGVAGLIVVPFEILSRLSGRHLAPVEAVAKKLARFAKVA